MDSYTTYDQWIRDFFVKLMGTIEKHVMVNVQHEFNSLFQKWFSTLVMDEELSARVDDRFSVIIEQGGFETEYSFMSGGERTAVALAYRLALNRVINDLTENIKTKDLMILDEPTDGFSSDQMDSVRDVLNDLNSKQTIIVSHEPKVESFVDTTLRFVKENGVSRVIHE
jgi:exonuclease SbcC